MEEEIRPGYYRDHHGNWQKERRRQPDRRKDSIDIKYHDRRRLDRRKTDLEIMERESREEIEQALEEFAAEHQHPGPKE